MDSSAVSGIAPWSRQLRKLKLFTVAYVVLLIAMFSLMSAGKNIKGDGMLGGLLILTGLAFYIVALVYAYETQKEMNDAKVYSPGAWQVVVAGIILNPILGWLIIWSVIRKAQKLEHEWLCKTRATLPL
ncbi:MAG: hypothetical protein ABTQ25_16380 [Nitrosomonas ureae]